MAAGFLLILRNIQPNFQNIVIDIIGRFAALETDGITNVLLEDE
ncbi:hypothetical protein [Paenibacillus durus]|nr:hypothetical protein [Paenibacillus durus]